MFKLKSNLDCLKCRNSLNISIEDDQGLILTELFPSQWGESDEFTQCEECGECFQIKKLVDIRRDEKKNEEQRKIEKEKKEKERKERKRREIISQNAKQLMEKRNASVNVPIIDESFSQTGSVHKFFHITHIENLQSILSSGIYSHNLQKKLKIKPNTIADYEIMHRRDKKILDTGKSLFEWVNLYINPRNSMLYKLIKKYGNEKFPVIEVEIDIDKPHCYITDGNAAVVNTTFYNAQGISPHTLDKIKENADQHFFSSGHKAKPEVQAECLVHDRINTECFRAIHIYPSETMKNTVESTIETQLPINLNQHMFFR